MNRINEKWQAIILVTLVISFLSVGFSSYIIYTKKNNVDKIMNIQKNHIQSLIITIEKFNTERYQERIKSLLDIKASPAREKMLLAFKQQNRELLFQLSSPFYEILKKEDSNFYSFAWILDNNRVFLKLHDPDSFGDEVGLFRSDISKANKNYLQNTGYKAGHSGIQYRITQPVLYNGKHLGVVQFGLKDTFLLELINENMGIPAAIVIPNKIAGIIDSSSLPKFIGSTNTVQSFFIKKFNSEDIDWRLNEQQLNLDGRNYYILKIEDLPDFSGEPQGAVFISFDITDQITSLWKTIRFIIFLSVTFLIISITYLYKSLDGLLQKNIDLNKTLVEINSNLEIEVKKLNLAVNTAGDAILMTDERGFITYVNTAFTDIYNFHKNDIIGKTTVAIFKEGAKNFDEYVEYGRDLKNGQKVESELQYETNKGDLLTVEISSSPIFDHNNKIIGFLSIQRNITERKLIEKKIKYALSEKEALLRELYHRTQNNMQIISSMLSIKRSFIDNNVVADVFTDIDLKIQSMSLVHQKLFDSQDLSNINLKDYIKELCELYIDGYALDPTNITLIFDLEDITALIDIAIPLGLILSELESNSLKHAFPGGRKGKINIKLTELDEDFIELVYSDNGVGVPVNFKFKNQTTLGIETICMLAEDQLNGDVVFKNKNGVCFTVKFKKDIYKERI